MALYHPNITPQKRKKYCKIARSVSRNFIKNPLSQRKLDFSTPKSAKKISFNPVCTSSPLADKKTSTRHMGSFSLDCDELKDFVQYLQTVDGGNKSSTTAKLIGKDISKFLYYCNDEELDWAHIMDKAKLLSYFEHLKTNCSIGPEGRLTKLERTCDALNYLKMGLRDNPTTLNSISALIDQIGRWKASLRKEKKKLNHKRLEALSDTKLDVNKIKNFVENEQMWTEYKSIIAALKSGNTVSEKQLKFAMSAVMLASLFISLQRPGTVKNITLSEIGAAKKIANAYVITVADHKTGIGGVAHLTVSLELYEKMQDYISFVRPHIRNEDNINNVFILPGTKITKVSNIIRFMENELKIDIPSATEVRKIGATAVARQCTEEEARIVCKQMSHDPRVAAQYYQAVRGANDAKAAFDTIKTVLGESEPEKTSIWDTKTSKIVEDKFKAHIDQGKPPKQSECKNLFPNITAKQVVDKVRTFIRQKKRKEVHH